MTRPPVISKLMARHYTVSHAYCLPGGARRVQRGGGAGFRSNRHAGAVPQFRGRVQGGAGRQRPPRHPADGELARRAADVFQLEVLREGIQDFENNITRFFVVARGGVGEGADKTTIVFALPDEAGALFRALSVFALRKIDLTKLESRPIRGRTWEYMFYADLAVARDDLQCARALVNLAEFARWVRTLGAYKASTGVG